MEKIVNGVLRKIGFQIKRYPDKDVIRRMKILNSLGINVIFDIGANAGQYAHKMRELGYKGKIISFEPLSEAYKILSKKSSNDPIWLANNYAIGDVNAESFINIAGNSYSSSILNMLDKHIESAPESKYIDKEKIEIKKLDSIFKEFCPDNSERIMLKIDTQGYEKSVLEGAAEVLPQVSVIQLEMSLVSLYENDMLYNEMIKYLESKGFNLFSLENGFSNPKTGQLLQVDGIFVKK